MRTRKIDLLAKIGYIALQGVFLPLILWVNDLREAGQMWPFALAFALYEVLVTGDALLYWIVFRTEK